MLNTRENSNATREQAGWERTQQERGDREKQVVFNMPL